MESDLIAEYGYSGEHPDYPAVDWKRAVANNSTRNGYWQWVADNLDPEWKYTD